MSERTRDVWFDDKFGEGTPENLRRLTERLCRAYGITRGICDPMYIANVIASELGLGDGHGHFTADAHDALRRAAVEVYEGRAEIHTLLEPLAAVQSADPALAGRAC